MDQHQQPHTQQASHTKHSLQCQHTTTPTTTPSLDRRGVVVLLDKNSMLRTASSRLASARPLVSSTAAATATSNASRAVGVSSGAVRTFLNDSTGKTLYVSRGLLWMSRCVQQQHTRSPTHCALCVCHCVCSLQLPSLLSTERSIPHLHWCRRRGGWSSVQQCHGWRVPRVQLWRTFTVVTSPCVTWLALAHPKV